MGTHLKQNSGLSDSGISADQYQRAFDDPSTQHAIQFMDAGTDAGFCLSGYVTKPNAWGNVCRRLFYRSRCVCDDFFRESVPVATGGTTPGPFCGFVSTFGTNKYGLLFCQKTQSFFLFFQYNIFLFLFQEVFCICLICLTFTGGCAKIKNKDRGICGLDFFCLYRS